MDVSDSLKVTPTSLMGSPKAWPVICGETCPTRIQGALKLLGNMREVRENPSAVNRLPHGGDNLATGAEQKTSWLRSIRLLINRLIGDKWAHGGGAGGDCGDDYDDYDDDKRGVRTKMNHPARVSRSCTEFVEPTWHNVSRFRP